MRFFRRYKLPAEPGRSSALLLAFSRIFATEQGGAGLSVGKRADEPAAVPDPVAEVEICSRLNEIAGDKTALCFSRRRSSCKFCDEIAV